MRLGLIRETSSPSPGVHVTSQLNIQWRDITASSESMHHSFWHITSAISRLPVVVKSTNDRNRRNSDLKLTLTSRRQHDTTQRVRKYFKLTRRDSDRRRVNGRGISTFPPHRRPPCLRLHNLNLKCPGWNDPRPNGRTTHRAITTDGTLIQYVLSTVGTVDRQYVDCLQTSTSVRYLSVCQSSSS